MRKISFHSNDDYYCISIYPHAVIESTSMVAGPESVLVHKFFYNFERDPSTYFFDLLDYYYIVRAMVCDVMSFPSSDESSLWSSSASEESLSRNYCILGLHYFCILEAS